MKEIYTFRVVPEEVVRLRRIATELELTPSAVARKALRQGLDAIDANGFVPRKVDDVNDTPRK